MNVSDVSQKSEKIVIYSSKNPLRNPIELFTDLFSSIKASRELTWSLTIRDVTSKYRQTILGYFWAIFPPVLTSLLFIFLQKSSIINISSNLNVPYPVFIFSGSILWLLFTDSLNAPLRILQSNKSMLAKINFPREALLLSAFLQVMLDFFIRYVILLVVVFYFNYTLSWGILFYPILSVLICLFGMVLGIFLIPVGMLYSDITSAIPIVTQLWFFITPVIYDISLSSSTSIFFKLNPITYLFVAVRNTFLYGNFIQYLPILIVYFSILLIALFIAWITYKITLPLLIERF